jgi:outer membrane lipoprotein-sorting protein
MNKDNQLEQQLDQLGERIASQPSILDAVMQRVETMEAPSVRSAHRLGRIIMKATMAMAASIAVGVAVWLGISGGTAAKVYGMQDFAQRLQTAKSYHLKGTSYREQRQSDGTVKLIKTPTEMYVGWPCRYYTTWASDNNGTMEMHYKAEDAERYIEVNLANKTCRTGRNVSFMTKSFVTTCLEQQPKTLMREGSDYRLVRSEPIDGASADVYEVIYPLAGGEQGRSVVWLNPATGLPLRMTFYRQKTGQPEWLALEYDLVEVDAPPPAGMFSFEPPAGFEVIHEDRGPESDGVSWARVNSIRLCVRFRYNIDDRGMFICWASYDPSTTPSVECDPQNPPGQPMQLIIGTINNSGRRFRMVPLRSDPAKDFHWNWSLLVPDDGKPIGHDQPSLTIRNKVGSTTGFWAGASQDVSRQTLADFVVRAQRLTLPADAPADAALTLEQIEAKVAELTRQP